MARLRDIPSVWRSVGPFKFLWRVYQQIWEDNVLVWASALAYSWLFAIFPFILFLLTLIPYLPAQAKQSARHAIEHAIAQLPGSESGGATTRSSFSARQTVETFVIPRMNKMLDHPQQGLLSIGLIITLWAASGGMATTMAALDKCYDVKKPRPFYLSRPIAILMTVVVASMILVVVALIPIGTLVRNWTLNHTSFLRIETLVSSFNGAIVFAFDFSRWIIALALMFLSLAITYHYGPSFKGKWQLITPGAVFCVVVWIVLGMGFRYYIERWGKYNETYGAVGGVAILLLLFYLDAVVLLVGAEINSEIDFAMLNLPKDVHEFPQAALGQSDLDQAVAAAAVEEGLAVPTSDSGLKKDDS